MTTLGSLLKAAEGEIGRGTLWRWMQRVGALISDDSAAAAAPKEFAQADSTLAQEGVGLNSDIVLNRLLTSRGVTYNTATGVFTLTAGKVYHLVANGRFETFSIAAGGGLRIDWVNAVDNTPLANSVAGFFVPSTSTDPANGSPVVRAVHSPVAGTTTVKLRVTDATGTAVLPAAGFTAAVIEV